MSTVRSNSTSSLWIVLISIILPVVVALLYFLPKEQADFPFDIHILPALHATINGLTTVVLIVGFLFIRKGNIKAHKASMITALALSALFLASYVIYHSQAPATKYGGEPPLSYIYYFILITHIVLAAAIVPLVLITLVRAWSEKFDKHRKIAKWTLPLWLYVTVTGVIVYFMIAPYYN